MRAGSCEEAVARLVLQPGRGFTRALALYDRAGGTSAGAFATILGGKTMDFEKLGLKIRATATQEGRVDALRTTVFACIFLIVFSYKFNKEKAK